jgi:flagellar motor switch protein FliM
MQAFLSSRLREPTDVVVSSVEQATFAEFLFSLATPCGAVLFDLYGDRQYQGIMDFGTEASFYIIDRLFGGPGDAPNVKRPMTPLEQQVIKGVADRALRLFQDAWQGEHKLSIAYIGLESNPDTLNIADRDDNVLVANLEIRAGRFTSSITIGIPLQALESFLQERPKRVTKPKVVPTAERVATQELLRKSLRSAKIRVAARFPEFKLSARELSMLQAGQVIHTGHHLEVPIEVVISGERRFVGAMGQVHRNLGLRIKAPVDKHGRAITPNVPRGKVL